MPDCVREIWYEHWHRYAFASQFVAGRRVLDLASGEGYGSHLLAQSAESVVGCDISNEAIAHASKNYQASNLTYREASATDLPFADNTFDAVVSFETIEHLHEQEEMLDEFNRVLADDGILILSSPDKAEYSDATGHVNEYHVRELYKDELLELVGKRFSNHKLFGQKLTFASAIWQLGQAQTLGNVLTYDKEADVLKPGISFAPVYFIMIAARANHLLPEAPSANWFLDSSESVYEHYYHEIRKNMQAGAIINDRDQRIAELEAEVARLSNSSDSR